MIRSTVAVLKTSPETVVSDYSRLMELASFREALDPGRDIAVHPGLTLNHFFPSASTPPWQLDGVLGTLLGTGIPADRMFVWYDNAAGISLSKGRVLNRHIPVLGRLGVSAVCSDGCEPRVRYTPKTPLRVLSRLFPEGIPLPERLFGANILHLPTLKTDILSTLHGAGRSVLDGILGGLAHFSDTEMHGALVDALAIQKEIAAGMFVVMDGVFAGGGTNPRNLQPYERNVLLASSDPVALDSVALRLAGFAPLDAPYVRMAHEAGLGVGDPAEIEVRGADVDELSFQLSLEETPGARRVRSIERATAGNVMNPFGHAVSVLYYDWYWFLTIGEDRIRRTMRGAWGPVFERYRR